MNIRSVLYILGILTSTLGCMMLFPAIFNFIKHENEWTIFASTGIIVFFIGITIILAFKSRELKIGNKETSRGMISLYLSINMMVVQLLIK